MRIPSISADEHRHTDVQHSADATASYLHACGLENVHQASVPGCPPAVIGEWLHAEGRRPSSSMHITTCSRPASSTTGRPIRSSRWSTTAACTAGVRLTTKAGAVAHGAAVKAWLDTTGALPCNVKVFIEGEEEIGSPHLAAFLAEYADELRSDVLLLADAGNWSVGTPGLTYSLRGLASGDVTVRSLDGPVHSGIFGGPIPDPVQALAKSLAAADRRAR